VRAVIVTRRDALASLVLLPFARAADEGVALVDYDPEFRVDLQASGPRVKLFDLRALTSWQTPAERFFTFHHAWSLWTFEWTDATPGTHTVVSRATNSRGQIQPERSALISAREDNSQWPRRIAVAHGFRK
jgi:hypothetical protein